MLELPVTVRIPLAGEMPHRPDIEELLLKRKKAAITEGYKITPNTTRQLSFAFQAEININNSKLWRFVLALAHLLPEEICCEYGLSGEETVTTAYFSKDMVLQKLAAYQTELTQDCVLEFNLYAHTVNALTEINVTTLKYIRFSGSDKNAFLQCMQDFNLVEIPLLAFADDYPKIVEPLRKFIATARRPEDVIWLLNRAFGIEG
ncbi:hypothetical protein [Agriterribacter sp.]|uniref:hypothetical protein n=1 Tax=Agriterribacter sp. TaxID=2821509 RepID=UPI002C7D138A|nr:hypothetical protein [Agriterribacter sp.]HTN09131.1 hypothetical protein [Agriterribacter sp.]